MPDTPATAGSEIVVGPSGPTGPTLGSGTEPSGLESIKVEENAEETFTTPPPKRRRRSGSRLMTTPGTAEIKEYPVTKDELWVLGSVGASTTAAFSLATGMIGYYVNTGVNLALAQGVPKEILVTYETSRMWAWWVAMGLYLLGVVLAGSGGLKVFSILRRTTHGE